METKALLEKLKQSGPSSPLAGLAELSVDALLAHRIADWLPPATVVAYGRSVLTAWLDSPTAGVVLARVVEHLVHRLQVERRSLKDSTSPELIAAVRQVLSRPFSPDRTAVLATIDRGPMRELVRGILMEEVLEFARRASAPVAGMARGLGALARFAGETVKSRSGRVGNLVGAVGDEVERQLEKRAAEFVDSALGNVFGQVADVIADPARADEATELRLSILDGVLELTGTQLARELMNLDLPGAAELLRKGLKTWIASPRAERELLDLTNFFFVMENGTVAELLTTLGVLTPVRALLVEQGAERMRQVAQSEAFAAWLTAVTSA